MEIEAYTLTKEDKKILNEIKPKTTKLINYKQKIKRTEPTLTTNIIKDTINNFPQYITKTLKEERKIFKIMQLYYYPLAEAKEKTQYLQNFLEECPWFLQQLSSNITEEEKNKIFNKALSLAKETREYFIAENIRLVITIAKQFKEENIPYQDLIQEGTIGLIKAVDKFDISKNVKFSTYAEPWIKSVIRREIENKSRIIRLPNRVFQEVKKLNYQEGMLTLKLNRLPTSEELAKELKIPIDKVEEIKKQRKDASSLDESISTETEYNYENTIIDDKATDQYTLAEDNIINQQIKTIIENANLDEKSKQILFSYCGFDEKIKSTTDISKKMKISRYKVEQLKNQAIKELSQKQELIEIAYDCGIIKTKTKRI